MDYEKKGMQERIDALEAENKTLRNEISDLTAFIDAMKGWLRECPWPEAIRAPE